MCIRGPRGAFGDAKRAAEELMEDANQGGMVCFAKSRCERRVATQIYAEIAKHGAARASQVSKLRRLRGPYDANHHAVMRFPCSKMLRKATPARIQGRDPEEQTDHKQG